MQLALIFPGQGSQSVSMGRAIARVSPAAAMAWEEADATLGEPLSRLAWEGPAEQLDLTVHAQPALLAASVAAHRAWLAAAGAGGARAAGSIGHYAGHSMGQYSAMVAAGVLAFADALRLVRERGRLMQASSEDGAMAAVLGLADERLGELEAAGRAAGVLTIANRNAPGQVVISGERRAVEAATEAARELGARRVVRLPVSVAAHSPLMSRAAEGMRSALASVPFADPSRPLLANADAVPLTKGEACRGELVEHLTRGVDWVASVQAMRRAGASTFLEVGPGRVLVGLVRRIAPDARALATDDLVTDEGIRTTPELEAVASGSRAQE